MEGFSKRNVRRLVAKKKRELLATPNISENINPGVSNSDTLTEDAIQDNLKYIHNIESEFNSTKPTIEERLARIEQSQKEIEENQKKILLNQDAMFKELKLVKESNIDVVAKFHTILTMMAKKNATAIPDNCFPIKTFDELGNIDALCATTSSQYAKLIESIIQPEGIKKNFHRIIDRTLVLQLNYDGTSNKKAFKDFNFLNASIFEALQKDGYTEKEYISDIRIAIKNLKGIHYKQQCNERKKQKMEESNE